MNILLDECLDWRLSRRIAGHNVKSVKDTEWAGVKNGALLTLAATQFDVFVTVDRNLPFQQNISNYAISIIVLRAPSNRLPDLLQLVPALVTALDSAAPGTVTIVGPLPKT